MPDLVSRPYNPDPANHCPACVWGRGVHAEFCPLRPWTSGDTEYTLTDVQLDKWVEP